MDARRFDHITRLLATGGTRRQAMGVALAGGLSRFAHRRQDDTTPQREITIDEITDGRIVGEVVTGDTGMRFKGWLDQMPCVMAQRPDGSELFAIKRDGDDVVTTLAGGALATRLPLAEAKAARKLQYPEIQIERVHASATVEGDPAILQDIVSQPEYALMPSLSFAFGALGATGKSYPPVLAIHATGLAAAAQLDLDPDHEQATYILRMRGATNEPLTQVEPARGDADPQVSERLPTVFNDQIVAANLNPQLQIDPCTQAFDPTLCQPCLDHPNPDDCCHGMCGPCCNCWSRVCGDCCYHQFCADHDSLLGQCDGASDVLVCIASYFPANFIVEGCDGELFG